MNMSRHEMDPNTTLRMSHTSEGLIMKSPAQKRRDTAEKNQI